MKGRITYSFLLLLIIIFTSCNSSPEHEEFFGTYVMGEKENIDTLILYKELKFYHAVTENGVTNFMQYGNINIIGDVFNLVEFRHSSKDSTEGWDCNGFMKSFSGEIRIVVGDGDNGSYYTKVK